MELKVKSGEMVWVAILLLLLISPNLLVAMRAEELEGLYLMKAVYLVVSLACLFLPAIFLKKRAYFLFEGIFSLLLAPVEVASIFLNRTYTHTSMMDVIFSTNCQEAVELLSSLWTYALLFLCVVAFYFYLTFSRITNEQFFSPKVRRLFLLLLPFVFVGGFCYYFTLARNLLSSEKTTLADNLIDTKDLIVEKFERVFPFDVYFSANQVFELRREVAAKQAQLADFSFGIQPKTDGSAETVVLVIGETARWKNFGINGYERNTTPNLSLQKNLVSYSRMLTQANLTSHSVPLILSRADALCRDRADEEKSISEAFAEAGFETAWMSTQVLSLYQKRIVEACDNRFIMSEMLATNGAYDMDLLPEFERLLGGAAKKKFIVIHTMGSHFQYHKRYPEDSTFFKPSFDNTMDFLSVTAENALCLRNAYDNSIRYTDAFLSALIKKLEKSGGVWSMLYLSDHGENLFDDERNLVLHASLVVSAYEAHIPFLVAYSDEFRAKFPEKVANMEANKDVCQTAAVVFHSLLDMADIPSDVVDRSLCITRGELPSLREAYVVNGDKEPVLFDFALLETER